MNPLNKSIISINMYFKLLLSVLQYEQGKNRARRAWERPCRNPAGPSGRRKPFINNVLEIISFFERKHPTVHFPDENMEDLCESTDALYGDYVSSSEDSDVETDWRVEDDDMMREVRRMVDFLNSNNLSDLSA